MNTEWSVGCDESNIGKPQFDSPDINYAIKGHWSYYVNDGRILTTNSFVVVSTGYDGRPKERQRRTAERMMTNKTTYMEDSQEVAKGRRKCKSLATTFPYIPLASDLHFG